MFRTQFAERQDFSTAWDRQPSNPFFAVPLTEVPSDFVRYPRYPGTNSKKQSLGPRFLKTSTKSRSQKAPSLQEWKFAMTKVSMLLLVFGLMFLGALFFITGFLTAASVYGVGNVGQKADGVVSSGPIPHQHLPASFPVASTMPYGPVPPSIHTQERQIISMPAHLPSVATSAPSGIPQGNNAVYVASPPVTGYAYGYVPR